MLVSCEGILDEQIPAHQTVDGNVITDESTAEVALVGVYSYLGNKQWEWYYSRAYGHLAGTTRGSGSASGTNEAGFEGAMIFNTMVPDEYGYLGIWKSAYLMVNGANTMINLTNNVSEDQFSEGRKESIIAEATFLRFFAHFHLFRCFAYFWDTSSPYGVLYRTEPSGLSNHKQARLTVDETYTQLLADLDYVIENGPEHTDIYHVSKYTAMAFKAKVLAMRGASGDYEKVVQLVDQVLQGPFSLHQDYYSYSFNKKTSNETIFGRHFASNLTGDEIGLVRGRVKTYYRATEFLNNVCSTSRQYAKAVNDTVQYYNFGDDKVEERDGTITKIVSFGESETELVTNAAFTYIRLAELLVLKAEAIARTSGDATAVCNILNPLLERAEDIPMDPSSFANQEQLLSGVYFTLIKEMCCESGLDWEASFRFKITSETPYLISQKEGLQSTSDLDRAIMPIPIEELNINDVLVQNPAYEGL